MRTYQFVLRVKREVVEEYTVDATSPEEARWKFSRGEAQFSHEIDGETVAVRAVAFDTGSEQLPVEDWPPAAAFRRERRPRK